MSLNPDTGTLAASTASAHITTDNVKQDSEDQRFNPFSQHYHLIISIW